jgi:ABC-2 type transport system permease protein
MSLAQKLYTVWAFFVVNLKRLFRDRLALFFTFLFPLIFLFVFGALSNNSSGPSFHVALVNQSDTQFAKQFTSNAEKSKVIKVDKSISNLDQAKQKMDQGQLDATIVLPKGFGALLDGKTPSGQAVIRYTGDNEQAATTLEAVLLTQFKEINSSLVRNETPFTVKKTQINQHGLRSFDYTFTGLLGFAILGAGVFGPMNVFPELKKMGILRRLRTTPLRVWQFFLSNMFGNAVTGLLSVAVMFIVAIAVFNLKMIGNYLELTIFLALGIVMILGIGLAIGGWAKNERQAAPLGNIIVFPLMFLSGIFFPRFLMPEWLQGITTYLPLTPVIDGSRKIIAQGMSLTSLGPELGIIAAWAVIIYLIAFRVFRWE